MADLLRLPSARIFPPLLGSKRGRKADGPAPGPLDDAATAPPRAAHPLLAGGMQLRGKGAGLLRDPTSLLLLEAASQLNELVHAQLERRMLKVSRQGGAAEAAPTDSVSEAEEEAGGACESACGAVCVAALSLRSTQHGALSTLRAAPRRGSSRRRSRRRARTGAPHRSLVPPVPRAASIAATWAAAAASPTLPSPAIPTCRLP